MNIDRRVTNGLAWAGVLLVVGIPAADLVSAQFMGDRAAVPAQVAVIEPAAPVPAPLSQRPDAPTVPVSAVDVAVAKPAPVVAPAVVKPTAPAAALPAAQTANVVDSYLQSGKNLPSYITDAPGTTPAAATAQVAATPPVRPQIITPTTASAPSSAPTDPIQVASIPAKVAPVPMPLSMRPSAVVVPVAAVAPSNELIVIPPSNGPIPPANVTAADLEDWETGPLSDFLASRQQQQQAEVDTAYDEDGFFLDDGPSRPRRSDRLIGPAGDFYFPFMN